MKGDHGNMKEPFGGSGKLFCDTTPSPPSPPLTMNNDLLQPYMACLCSNKTQARINMSSTATAKALYFIVH